MAEPQWLSRWGEMLKFLTGLAAMGAIVFSAMTYYADNRYVEGDELRSAIESLHNAIEDATSQRTRSDIEFAMRDLEDDIVFFEGHNQHDLAVLRCRKLARHLRRWNDLTGREWARDPAVERICR